REGNFDLRAHTVVYDRLFKDEERHYSKLVADRLKIPIHYLVVDDYELYEKAADVYAGRPEPLHDPLARISFEQMQQLGKYSRVVLTGYGLDPAIVQSHTYGPDLIRRLRFGELAKSAAWFLFVRRQLPTLGFRGWLRNLGRARAVDYPTYPGWLNRSFATRLNLRERWQEINDESIRT